MGRLALPDGLYRQAIEKVERETIQWALGCTKYNYKAAAELLGISREWLYQRTRALGLTRKQLEEGTE